MYSNFTKCWKYRPLFLFTIDKYPFLLLGWDIERPHIQSSHVASLQWRHNGRDGVSNHQPHDCLFGRKSKKISKLRVTGIYAGNSPVTGEFPAQMASNSENVSIWWRHHVQVNKMALTKLYMSQMDHLDQQKFPATQLAALWIPLGLMT